MPQKLSERTIVLVRLIDRGCSALTVAFRWIGICVVTYLVYLSISELAGQQTEANISILVEFLFKTSPGLAAAGGLAGGTLGVGYGLHERRLRRQTVERLQGRIKKYEHQIDPNRTSSGLTTQGLTNPIDAEV